MPQLASRLAIHALRTCIAQDMKLVWENCHLYNGPHQELGKLGEKTFATFQRLWKHSGLENTSSLRHRRSNAGVAAAKYEPDPAEARPKPSGGQPARSTKSRKVRGLDACRTRQSTAGDRYCCLGERSA